MNDNFRMTQVHRAKSAAPAKFAAPAFLCGSLLAAGLVWLCAYLTLRYFGALLEMPLLTAALGAETQSMLAEIFSQLSHAVIRPDILALAVLWGLYVWLCRRRRTLRIWLTPLFVLCGYLSAVCFASVNGVLFFDILRSLVQMIRNGLFEVL